MKYIIILMLTSSAISCKGQDSSFTPGRVQQSATITLDALPAVAFPYFGIIKEKEWDSDWNPTPIYPATGTVTEGSVYQTPGHVHGEAPLTWIITRYDSTTAHLTYLVTASNRIISIDIQCTPLAGNRSRATITYTMTGLTAEGNEIIRHHIAKIFSKNLQNWQSAINAAISKAR